MDFDIDLTFDIRILIFNLFYMSLFSKIFSRADSECYLALDIGTEMAKALVFQINAKEKKGIIIGVGREKQKKGNMQSGAVSDISGVIETCQNTINKALENAGVKKVKKAIVGIAGELVKGTTTTVHYERGNPDSRIDFPELKNIIQKVQAKAYERIQQQIEWETGRISRSRIIVRQYAEALLGTISTTDHTMRANEKFIRRRLDVGAVGNIFSLGDIGINLEK